jgi:hypothetical protein
VNGRSKTVVLLFVVAGFFGCEWESTDDSRSSNSDISVNVSGAYRDAAGSFLVRTSGPSAAQSTSKAIGTGDGANKVFSGTLSSNPIARGTVSVTDGSETWNDVDGDGTMSSSLPIPTGSGSVNYDTGAVTVTFTAPPSAGATISATFNFFAPGTVENPTSGKSGSPIFLFTVRQNGNRMDIVDDLGDSYVGRIEDPFTDFSNETESDAGTTTTTDGTTTDQTAIERAVGLSYPFEVSGTSAGNPIRIVGTIKAEVTTFFAPTTDISENGVVTSGLEEVFQRTSFRMVASWIEVNSGASASIDAVGPSDEGSATILP